MRCEFKWIPPAEMGDHWQTIKPGLVETAEISPGCWAPSDVFIQLVSGESVLHLMYVEGKCRGFIITKPIDSLQGKKLLIWILHGDLAGDVMVDNMKQVRKWAKNIGAVKVQFHSPRKGWQRVGKKLGFEPTMQIYESEVE